MLNVRLLHGLASPDHPVWMCGMRPFFLLTAWSGIALMLPWLAFLTLGTPMPAVAASPWAWHAHELLFGMALASVAGFVLTAVPEFTATADFSPRVVRQLVLLWCAARWSLWLSGVGGVPMQAIAALTNVALPLALVLAITPRLWRDPQRAHLPFAWALAALAGCTALFHAEVLLGAATPGRWLQAAVHGFMVLVILAQSRISMRVVNQALEDAGNTTVRYLARPPRRNLAMFCIGLYATAELFMPDTRLSGWFALAAAAAVFNLMNDWHVGRALLRRRPLMLYGVYACMGAGYALIGASLVMQVGSVSGGRHLLTVGALGLSMLSAMSIAARAHCGLAADPRPWVAQAALALLLAASARAAAAWHPQAAPALWSVSGLAWCGAFGLWAWALSATLLAPRSDGHGGCHGTD